MIKWNNKILAAIFFVLLTIWVLNTFLSGPKTRSFKSFLTQIDTSLVDKMVLFPKGIDSIQIELLRNGNEWIASNGSMEVKADVDRVKSILGQIANVPAKQLISKSADKRVDYEVEEESGKVVEVYQGGKLSDKIIFGRFNFNPNTRQGTSYARLADEEDIYSIDGFMSMSFDTEFDSFRNKDFLTINKQDIKSLLLKEGNQEIQIELKPSGQWTTEGNVVVDSTKMDQYLNNISNIQGRKFADDFNPSRTADEVLEIIADNAIGPIEIAVFHRGNDFVLKSASNPAFFSSDSTGIYQTLFINLKEISD